MWVGDPQGLKQTMYMEKKTKKGGRFRFKRFEVCHSQSSMKVGVDGVLVGLWAGDGFSPRRILDAGCGCGVIALICAQRWPEATVDAIDTDSASVFEASSNFNLSPWNERLVAIEADYTLFSDAGKHDSYDLIVSNPPFFASGVTAIDSPRLAARHQAEFSPRSLVELAPKLLTESGRVALIMPTEFEEELTAAADNVGLYLVRKTLMRGHPNAPWKRILMEFSQTQPTDGPVSTELTLETHPGEPTPEYLELGRDFYLKF